MPFKFNPFTGQLDQVNAVIAKVFDFQFYQHGRYKAPVVSYGGLGGTATLGSFNVFFIPFWFDRPTLISEVVLEVTTTSSIGGATITGAAYASKSTVDPTPALKITGSDWIDAADSTGIKTPTITPFTVPKGLVWFALKQIAGGGGDNNLVLKGWDGVGRESALLAGLWFGFGASPTTSNSAASFPLASVGDTAVLASSYAGFGFGFSDPFGTALHGIFVK